MKILPWKLFLICAGIIGSLIITRPALSIPTFQAYIDGATAGTYGSDEETWFASGDPFTLRIVGAYQKDSVKSIEGVTLLISVPEGETGTISISPDQGDLTDIPKLMTTQGASGVTETNPTKDATIDILTDVSGNDAYATIETDTFLPSEFNMNNHYPLHDNVSNFILFDLGSFSKTECNLNNYNADNSGGTITQTSACGEEKVYEMSYTGFSWMHFDVYGLVIEQDSSGNEIHKKKNTWETDPDDDPTWVNSPGSHDATHQVPEPSTFLLLVTSLSCLAIHRISSWRHKS